MTLDDFCHAILATIFQLWQFDINAMSHSWMYWPFFIPITLYLAFFIVKWTVITWPIWYPLARVLSSVYGDKHIRMLRQFNKRGKK